MAMVELVVLSLIVSNPWGTDTIIYSSSANINLEDRKLHRASIRLKKSDAQRRVFGKKKEEQMMVINVDMRNAVGSHQALSWWRPQAWQNFRQSERQRTNKQNQCSKISKVLAKKHKKTAFSYLGVP